MKTVNFYSGTIIIVGTVISGCSRFSFCPCGTIA